MRAPLIGTERSVLRQIPHPTKSVGIRNDNLRGLVVGRRRWRDSNIGAHAVVNPDASGPEFAIAAGVPAKFLWGTEGT